MKYHQIEGVIILLERGIGVVSDGASLSPLVVVVATLDVHAEETRNPLLNRCNIYTKQCINSPASQWPTLCFH